MKKFVLLVILAFSMVLSPLATTIAATPKLINYQGQLEGISNPQDPKLVVFEIFEDAAGGSALWIEQKNVTVDKNGYFSTYLGDSQPIDLKFDKQYYVQITVGNNQPFPRTRLTSAPSAFHAIDADTAQHAFTAGMANDVIAGVIGFDNLAPEVLIAGGDLMGMYPNPQIRPSAILSNIPDGSITSEMLSPNVSTSPSGPAGGDLTGTFPDPLIAVGAVKTDRIADGAVTNEKIVSLDAAKLTNVSSINFQVAVMTDATINGDGTLLNPLGLADDAVMSNHILDGQVMTADLMDLGVTNGKLALDAVMSTNIVDGQVMTADLMDLGVTNAKLAMDAVMSMNIVDGQVMTVDIADLAVTNAKLAVDAVRMTNIDVNGGVPTDGEFLSWDDTDGEMRWVEPTVVTSAPLTGNGQTATPVTLDPNFGNANELLIRTNPSGWVSGLINTANLTPGSVTSPILADNSVMTNHIMDGQVMTADLMDGAVNSAKILDESIATIDLMDASVTSVKIADNSIMTNHIVDGQVMTADLMDLGVTTGKVADMAITTGKLADGSVTTLKIADGNVMTVDIADVNVTEAKLADNAVSTRTIVAGAVTEPKMADNSVSNRTIQTDAVTTVKIADANITTAKLADGAVTTPKIADLAVTNEKVGSGTQPQGKIMKATGAGGVSWEDDEGLILPWTGSYDGPGDAFTLTHTGIAGNGSAAVFNSTTSANTDPTVEVIKDVSNGAGSALLVRGIGVQGANYIATFDNQNVAEGRTVLMENTAPTQLALTDPGTPGDLTDDYVTPDPTGTDVEDATLVLRNKEPNTPGGATSGQILALKTYGSIQANSSIQGTDLIAHNGEIIVNNTGLAGGTLFITENAMEKISFPLLATEDFQMFNTGGDFDLNLDGHIDVQRQARIGDGVDENQTTVDGAVTAVTITGPANTASTVATANADLLVNGDAQFEGSLTLGGGADTYNSVNDIYISTDLTTVVPVLPAPPTTVILNSNDAQAISARAVEDALLNHTLQVAYNNGNSIIATDAEGDIAFTLEEATDFTVVTQNVGNDVIVTGAGYIDAQVNLINRAAGTAVIVEDDLEPQADNTFDLGSDLNRWQDAYVNGASVHIGPTGGQAGATELAVGYAANAATFTVDGAVVTTMDAGNDNVTIDPDGDGTQEVWVDALNNNVTIDADGDGNNEFLVDPAGFFGTSGVITDGNDDGVLNLLVNGTLVNVDANGDGINDVVVDPTNAAVGFTVNSNTAGGNEITSNAAGIRLDVDGDGTNNFNATGVLINMDANDDGMNNVVVDPATTGFSVNANTVAGNELSITTAGLISLNSTGTGLANFTANNTNVTLDPIGDGTNYTFAEAGLTISNPVAPGDIVLSDAGVNTAVTQTFAFTGTGANQLNVSLDGALTGLNVGHNLGTVGTNGNVLAVNGLATLPLPLAAADYELAVTGDALITGTLTLPALTANSIMVTDAASNVITDSPNFTYNSITNVMDVQGTIINSAAGLGVTINDDLRPLTDNTNDLGSDLVRWQDAYINGASVHVGPSGGQAGNTELAVGYAANAGTFNVNGGLSEFTVTAATNITMDPNADGTNYTFAEAGVTLSNGGAGDVVLSDLGANTAATQTYAFTGTGVNQLNVSLDGALTGLNVGHNLGTAGTNGNSLAVNGLVTPVTISGAGVVTVAPLAADQELAVAGDASISGSLTLGAAPNSVNDIFIASDLVANLFPVAPASNDGQLVTALAVQTALLNHDLQVAYNNGNTILTNGNGDIDFDLAGGEDLHINGAAIGDDVIIDGLGLLDVQVEIQNTATNTVTVNDNMELRGNLFSDLAGNDGTPLNITDDVTATMQDANDNFEITGAAATTGFVAQITKLGGDIASALEVITNEVGVNVSNPGGAANAIAFQTSLTGASATGVKVTANGATANGVQVDGQAGTGVKTTVTTGVAVLATASAAGSAVVATNISNDVTKPTIKATNTSGANNAFALSVDQGHTNLSSDAAAGASALNIVIGDKTIIRYNTGGPGKTIDNGTKVGQTLIIVNESGVAISFGGANCLGAYTVNAGAASMLVWTGGAWAQIQQ